MSKGRMTICLVVVMLLVSGVRGEALTDNFDNGINSTLWTEYQWQVTTSSGYIVPVQVSAPDEFGRLKIIKNVEQQIQDYSSFEFGINSSFMLRGNFIMSVDFNLLNFPQVTPAGCIDAALANKPGTVTYFYNASIRPMETL